MAENKYSEVTNLHRKLADTVVEMDGITEDLYRKYDVKRGLRDINGKGVLTGLTEISEVKASETDENGVSHPCDGELYYRGLKVDDLIDGCVNDNRFGFEEITYLLLFGKLPDKQEFAEFKELLGDYRSLPKNFVRDVIMKKPSKDIMNAMARSVLTLYSYDENPDDVSLPNVIRQSVGLISEFPLLAAYSYQAYRYAYEENASLIIHEPDPNLSTAENLLRLIHADGKFDSIEAQVLDIALILHAEHGGGNNSSFTTHVVTSSGTDTYAAISSALASLKGPKHGGANLKVVKMFDDIKANVKNWEDRDELTAYIDRILHKDAFDKTGLVYGMGHAVYSISDPRARIFKGYVEKLAKHEHYEKEFALMSATEEIAANLIAKERKIYKGVSANVDFYSGFVYSMLGIPRELFTPIFAVARVAGWSAHRMEELINCNKIIRPAYMNIHDHEVYVPLDER